MTAYCTNYVGFYLAGGTQGAPTLTYQNAVNTGGKGIGGGFFAAPRVNLVPDAAAQCVYASNATTGDISGINVQTQTLAGVFPASGTDVGDANGIGLVLNANYFYAGYSTSNTIATFSVLPGCALLCQRRAGGRPERRFDRRAWPCMATSWWWPTPGWVVESFNTRVECRFPMAMPRILPALPSLLPRRGGHHPGRALRHLWRFLGADDRGGFGHFLGQAETHGYVYRGNCHQ